MSQNVSLIEPPSSAQCAEHPSSSTTSAPIRSLRGKHMGMVSFSPYPEDPRPRRAVEALLAEGMSVDMICVREGDQPKREVKDGLTILRIGMERRRGGKLAYAYQYSAFIILSGLLFAWRALKRRYDLIYVNNMPDVLVLSSVVPKLMGAKVILDLHDPMPELMMTIFNLEKESLGVRVLAKLEKWSMAFADQVVTVNRACKRIFGQRSCPPDKIGVVMNSPDEKMFPFRQSRDQDLTNRLSGQPFVIMYHGSIVERNGLQLAVDALPEIMKVIPSAELRIFGRNTPFLESVMADVISRGLQAHVRYLGSRRLEELVAEIEDADVGVIPNQENAFTAINTPTRIFEYLSVGTAVIAPRTTGITDYFDEDSLILFQAGSATDLAQAVITAATHPKDALETAKRGQQVYLNHTWEQERQKLIEVVANLLSGENTKPSNWL